MKKVIKKKTRPAHVLGGCQESPEMFAVVPTTAYVHLSCFDKCGCVRQGCERKVVDWQREREPARGSPDWPPHRQREHTSTA